MRANFVLAWALSPGVFYVEINHFWIIYYSVKTDLFLYYSVRNGFFFLRFQNKKMLLQDSTSRQNEVRVLTAPNMI